MDAATIKDLVGSIGAWGWAVPVTLAVVLAIVLLASKQAKLQRWTAEYRRVCKLANLARKAGRMGDAVSFAHDAQELRRRIESAGGVIAILTAICGACVLGGCVTKAPVLTVVGIDRMIKAPEPGQAMTIPELKPPALQWYLVDDAWIIREYGVDVD